MSCEKLTVPLNSCTIAWADPGTTLPKGRLQGHIRIHETGGLEAVCPTDECNNCGRGLAVCIRGEDPCDDLESPPSCLDSDGNDLFKNSLRRDSKGKLWVDVRRVMAGLTPTVTKISQAAGVAPASGGHTFTDGTAEFTNNTCFPMKVKIEACVKGALIGGPEPTGQGTVTVNGDAETGQSINCSDIGDCRTPARIIYELTIDGEACPLFSSSGDYDVYSGTICVDVVTVEPGQTITNSIAAALRYEADARDSFPVSSGDISICYTPAYDITEDC